MRVTALILIAFYRLCLSPLLPGACRFSPSCSCYAQDAFRSHGWFKASWLAAGRLARCHPWGSAGFDPVPQAAKQERGA